MGEAMDDWDELLDGSERCGAPILHPYLRTSSGYPFVLAVETTKNRSKDDLPSPRPPTWHADGWGAERRVTWAARRLAAGGGK